MADQQSANAAEETRALPMATRDLSIRSDSFDEGENTVEVVWTTGARGTRMDWRRYELIDEELSCEPGHVRLDRLNAGAPVLNTHQKYDLEGQIGVVVPGTARMAGGEGTATLRLSRRESVAPIVADIRDGIIRNLSVGYRVHEFEITEREGERALYRAVDWEPYEISFVPLPFDAGAQVRAQGSEQGGFPCIIRRASPATQETQMDPEAQAGTQSADTQTRSAESAQTQSATTTATAEQSAGGQQQRQTTATVSIGAIRIAATNAGLDADATFELIEEHERSAFTTDALMANIGRRFAERDQGGRTVNRVPAQPGTGATLSRAMSEAVYHRMAGGDISADARNFRGMGLLRMAEELLGSSGISTRGMTANEIAERALHTTSDFPALMSNAMNRRLRAAYAEHQPTYRQWARRAPNAPNFKSIDVVQMSAMPDLLKVNEAGEFRYGTASDGKTSYALATYGRIISLSRQLIINDDLGALDRAMTGFAAAANRLENRTVYSQLTANPTMSDGVALFHATHGNLAQAGGVIGPATLNAGRGRMRKQKGLQGEELNIAPAFLIVPTDLEQVAYQYTSAQYVPAKQSDTNEFRAGGRTALEPIVEPVLDGNSGTAWYLAARSGDIDTVEYCYLEGAEGVQLSSRMGFTVDGVELKASLDFAASTIDWRGLDKNPGA
jgi:hypothetical protein